MEIYENTTIYIVSPAGEASGGPELLHQLGSELLRRGLRAVIYYANAVPGKNPRPDIYRKYHVPFTTQLDDEAQNILILAETETSFFFHVHHIRKILWWLSVDFYFHNLTTAFAAPPAYFFTHPLTKCLFLFSPEPHLEHWVQSEYARQFVLTNHVPEERVRFVGDYLQAAAHLGQMCVGGGQEKQRQNIVTFNPAKGFDFTKQLIGAAPDIIWGPISHMTPEDVHTLLSSAKCYIDFGNHPGQDRIPREAAAAGCCVITGKRGAAANDIDVPIPSAYKFDDTPENIPAILACIRDCLAHYEAHTHDFDSYRTMIAGQRERFRKGVAAALPVRYDVRERQRIVVQKGPHPKELLLALLAKDTVEIVGVWFPENTDGALQIGDRELPILWTDEVPFLYLEDRIDAILLDETDGKGAAQLTARGVPSSILC